MAEERKNKLLESPLYAFVAKGWVKWSQKIVSLQAGEEDFLLYLVWALDTIKEQEDGINASFYDTVFNALRNSFRASQFNTNKDDLEYLTNLVCAAALACFGLTLTDSLENQKIYSELVSGFGENWKEIQELKSSMDTSSPDLKEWAVEYVEGDDFNTYSNEIEWNNDDMAEVLIRKASKFKKIDLYRVIMALYKINAFEAADGGELSAEKVFQAFGQMLGEKFDNFNNNLAAGSVTQPESIDIFERLQKSFEKYESAKDNKLRKQGRPTRRVEPE